MSKSPVAYVSAPGLLLSSPSFGIRRCKQAVHRKGYSTLKGGFSGKLLDTVSQISYATTRPGKPQRQVQQTRMRSGEEGTKEVPINLPAGVLLLLSGVLAISTIGCLFELSSGHPQYGVQVTEVILVVSLPSFLYLFYAAIRKGQAESQE